MRLFKYASAAVIIAAVIFACGCDGKNYADISSNVKYVSAAYCLGEMTNDPEDRLIKNAEVAYTKMNISPSASMAIKGFSFDAVLKDKGSEQKFYLKAYITNSAKALTLDGYATCDIALAEDEIVISGEPANIAVIFNRPYSYDLGDFNNSSNTYTLCVEFLNSLGEKNKTVKFSIDNINLLT
jgi:hypothetical protein